MNDSVRGALTEVFRDVLDDDSLVLNDSTCAADVDGWDSITHVLLVVAVEAKFGIRLSSGEIQRLKNVGELAALVEAKLSQAG